MIPWFSKKTIITKTPDPISVLVCAVGLEFKVLWGEYSTLRCVRSE